MRERGEALVEKVAEIVLEQPGAENSPGGRVKDAVGKLITRDARHEHDASAGASGHGKSCVFRHASCFEP